MSKKPLLKPLFSDILKPGRLINKKNPYHEILEEGYSGPMGGDKRLSHKRDRRESKFIIEDGLNENDE